MILTEIRLTDFRSFAGTHRFDLEPRSGSDGMQPIVLFGGLNGSGKTSILTAVRLALYGKQCLGVGTSVREYHEFLGRSIHQNPKSVLQSDTASVEVRFRYTRQGVREDFHVVRYWRRTGKSIKEDLRIRRNGQSLEDLSGEQAQGFLNELIPLGVADLFFFDGEKIAELAEDDTGKALQQAVKKLLGLDIVDRLSNDLALFIRRESRKQLPDHSRAEIEGLEQRMEAEIQEKEAAVGRYEHLRNELTATEHAIARLEHQFAEHGGSLANRRADERTYQNRLLEEQEHLRKELLKQLGGAYPLSLAPEALKTLLSELEQALETRKRRDVGARVAQRLEAAEQELSDTLPETSARTVHQALQQHFGELLEAAAQPEPRFDITDSELAQYQRWVLYDATESARIVAELKERLEHNQSELDNSSLRLERMPDDATLANTLEELKALHSSAGQLREQMRYELRIIKQHLRECQTINRHIERAHNQLESAEQESSALTHAHRARRAAAAFAYRNTERQLSNLEHNFLVSYKKLTRKEAAAFSVRVDPDTFDITLYDEAGNALPKSQISAGEKQIYAVALLEALGKTSGRKLPLIIDTPLGRLDSDHRGNLIDRYFPNASHQVIILSTDTEIEEVLHQRLQTAISHEYQLDYDEEQRTTFAYTGYFWTRKTQSGRYRAS